MGGTDTACGEVSGLIHLHVTSVTFGSDLLTSTSGGWLPRVTQYRRISPLPPFITISFLYHSLPYHPLSSFASLLVRTHYADPSVYFVTPSLPSLPLSIFRLFLFVRLSVIPYHIIIFCLSMPVLPVVTLRILPYRSYFPSVYFYLCHLYPLSVLLYATALTLLFRFWNDCSLFVISALLSLYLCNLRCHSLMSSR